MAVRGPKESRDREAEEIHDFGILEWPLRLRHSEMGTVAFELFLIPHHNVLMQNEF
jgi:hypothetical protein